MLIVCIFFFFPNRLFSFKYEIFLTKFILNPLSKATYFALKFQNVSAKVCFENEFFKKLVFIISKTGINVEILPGILYFAIKIGSIDMDL